jgi:hypothetical protein
MKPLCPYAVALLVGGTLCGHAAEPLKRLYAADIRAQVIGKTLTDRVHWSRRFRSDGSLETSDMGKRGNGRWKIEADQLCFGASLDSLLCHEVWASRTEVRLRSKGRLEEIAYIEKR